MKMINNIFIIMIISTIVFTSCQDFWSSRLTVFCLKTILMGLNKLKIFVFRLMPESLTKT